MSNSKPTFPYFSALFTSFRKQNQTKRKQNSNQKQKRKQKPHQEAKKKTKFIFKEKIKTKSKFKDKNKTKFLQTENKICTHSPYAFGICICLEIKFYKV